MKAKHHEDSAKDLAALQAQNQYVQNAADRGVLQIDTNLPVAWNFPVSEGPWYVWGTEGKHSIFGGYYYPVYTT